MIRLRISQRVLRKGIFIVLALAALAGVYAIGDSVTVRGEQGRPMVFSPSLLATERYRGRVRGWAAQMARIDEELAEILMAEPAVELSELYAQSGRMQKVGEKAAALAGKVSGQGVPVALMALRAQAVAAAEAYLEAALLMARWQAEPSQTSEDKALEALSRARSLRIEMEESQWLTYR